MIAYIWVSAGFAMVIIAAGLAAIPRDTLEAARTDGATEWQVFRRITVPLLAPVLTVVFVTQIIAVLKIFDLVLADRARLEPGRRDRARVRDVADVVQRPEPLRARLGDRDLPLDPLHPVPDRQRPALPGGGDLMATVAPTSYARRPRDEQLGAGSSASSARRRSTSCSSLIGVLWLIPTLGLFITSLLTPSDAAQGGWWNFLSKPSTWTLDNYANMFDNERITTRSGSTAQVTIGATVLPILVASLAAYALAWIEFPGRDWLFLAVIAPARRADPDGADPDLPALQRPQPLRHGSGPDPLPHGVRAAVRDLPAAQLLRRHPAGT